MDRMGDTPISFHYVDGNKKKASNKSGNKGQS